MSNSPKVSIIIPVYNTEKYLKDCLESVINQTYHDLEIICVNDGSTDNSLKVLNEYAEKDKRIKVYSQKNSGVGAARNKGIDVSTGDFMMFVDSDDTINALLVEKALNKAICENCGCVIYAFNDVYETKTMPDENKLRYLNVEKFSPEVHGSPHFCECAADKLFRSDIIRQNNIRFPENIRYGEDCIFAANFLYYNPEIGLLPEALYNYNHTRPTSAMSNNNKNLGPGYIRMLYYYINLDFVKKAEYPYKRMFLRQAAGAVWVWSLKCQTPFKRAINSCILKFVLPDIEKKLGAISADIPEIARMKDETDIKKLPGFIFSIKNEYNKAKGKKHKIITFFGFKLKIKMKYTV